MARTILLAAILSTFALIAETPAQGQGTAPVQPARSQGLKVTYAPLEADKKTKEGTHSYRARLLSLAVERGETPTPMLSPGMFEATFAGVLELQVRDRFHFQVEGRGSFTLSINGEKALSGSLRGKPIATTEPVRLKKGDNQVELRFESGVGGDGQLRVSWSGPEFAFEPIAPEQWSWQDDDKDIAAGALLRRGHQLFTEGRCVQCHRTEEAQGAYARGVTSDMGPDLRSVGARLHPAFLAEWVRDPKKVRPDASMPRFRLEKDSEYDDLAAWLATLGKPLEETPSTAEQRERGALRFLELGCIACHVPPGQKVAAENLHGRLALDFVPRKWRPSALQQFLQQPTRDHPSTRMPDFRLELDDAKALTAYLSHGAVIEPFDKGDADNGRRLAQRHGCDRCHSLELPDAGRRFQELRGLHQEHGCLAAEEKAPDFGFADSDRAAVRAFLPHAQEVITRRAPMDFAARMIPGLRCTNCHGMDGRASQWAQIAASMSTEEPLPREQDPVAQGVPALSWVGSKLQPSWMDRFVTGREKSPRPWLHARMPSFGTRGSDVISGLVRMHGFPAQDEPEQAPDTQLAVHGQKLVQMGEGFACVQCHGVKDKPPIQVFERQGINFEIAKRRLRRDYYMRWMLDPIRIDPDARMPKFADPKGKTAFTDVLGGDARAQFDAIWQWFLTL
ncbi:MAG: c-type cytochrome [Planctomycetota bacterium]